jgi:hypothetical protein
MIKKLTTFENEIMTVILDGNDPVLEILREQSKYLKVTKRKMTGVGFFTDFGFQKKVKGLKNVFPNISDRFWISDVGAEIEGFNHGAGFVLWVIDGFINMLEGYARVEPWPPLIESYTILYVGGKSRLDKLRMEWFK